MELFHLLNRGVDKRTIFEDPQDHARFVHNLYEFNDRRPVKNNGRRMSDLVGHSCERERLVDIHGWCLMKNHYHLLVSENIEGGLVKFIMKLNVGYAKYFNEKNKRSGTLFEGRTKKILIDSDAHFLHILHYIHLNPLDFLSGAKEWRERRIAHARDALNYLDTYRWSSLNDYCGKQNFPSIITKELFGDVFKEYRKELSSYLDDIDVADMQSLTLE